VNPEAAGVFVSPNAQQPALHPHGVAFALFIGGVNRHNSNAARNLQQQSKRKIGDEPVTESRPGFVAQVL
jgi:hypothetical protein